MYEVKTFFVTSMMLIKVFFCKPVIQARGCKKIQAQLSRALSSVLLTRKPKTKGIIYIFFELFYLMSHPSVYISYVFGFNGCSGYRQ